MPLTRRSLLKKGLVGATAAAWPRATLRAAQARRPRNVLFVCLDTVRADHLGCYGSRRGASPNVDRLAEQSVVFDDVVSPSSWTLPVLASVMTGLYPHEHGATYFRTPIRNGTVRIAEIMNKAGVATAAFGQFPFHFDFYRFRPGFEVFQQKWSQLAPATTRQVLGWLAEQKAANRPFFGWVHYFEPHLPYQFQIDSVGFYDSSYRGRQFSMFDPKLIIKFATEMNTDPQSRAELMRTIDLYDGEIFCIDKYLGQVLRELERLGMADDTMIVVMADHGEHFLEHGMLEHGNTLYQELIRVPLIVRMPGAKPARCGQMVSSMDLAPTILEYMGLSGPKTAACSLVPLLKGETIPERVLFSTLDVVTSVIFVPDGKDPSKPENVQAKDNTVRNIKVLRDGKVKLLYDAIKKNYELYNLGVDPREQQNVLRPGEAPPPLLKKELDDWLVAMEQYKPPVAAPDPAIIQSMRQLGYIQ